MTDLDAAIRQASEHLGVQFEPEEDVTGVERLGPRSRRPIALLGFLLVVAAGSAYLSLRAPPHPPAARVEAELRSSVAHLVRRVEDLRVRSGRLPTESELFGFLGESIEYTPVDGFYLVTGEAWGVTVEYDGSMPLDRWVTLRLYEDGSSESTDSPG